MTWSYVGHRTIKDHKDDIIVENLPELLSDIVSTERVLQGKVELKIQDWNWKNNGFFCLKLKSLLEHWRMEDEGWRMNDKIWRMKESGWRMKYEGWKMKDEMLWVWQVGWPPWWRIEIKVEDEVWRKKDEGWRKRDEGWKKNYEEKGWMM